MKRALILLLAALLLVRPAAALAADEQRAKESSAAEEAMCVAGGVAFSSAAPALVFLIIAAILASEGEVSGSIWLPLYPEGPRGSDPDDRPSGMGFCRDHLRSWHVGGWGANSLRANTPLAGRGAFEMGFVYRDFEYESHAGLGTLDVTLPPGTKLGNEFATFGGTLRYYPLGIDYEHSVWVRPYITGAGTVGWNPEGPEANILEYGAGLEISYGLGSVETAFFGEGYYSHVNAHGQGITLAEDDWTRDPTVMLGLRFRFYR